MGVIRNKKLHQKLANHSLKVIPDIPKEYFKRSHVPPPFLFNGKPENRKHYRYKIFLGETIRDTTPEMKVNYEFNELPSFYHARHDRFVNYQPDIFIEQIDKHLGIVRYSDIEINGGIHYKNDNQILKNKERKNLVFPTLQKMVPADKPDYLTIASYIIIEVDDFEYRNIETILRETLIRITKGGVYSEQSLD